MKLRAVLIFVLTLALLAAPLVAAQQTGKVYRIGFLAASSPSLEDPNWEAFVEKLRELGYVPGQNVIIERRAGEGRDDTSYAAAVDLLHSVFTPLRGRITGSNVVRVAAIV